MNGHGWLLGVRDALRDQREGSNGHKLISGKAVMKIIMLVIYVDDFYFPDCGQRNVCIWSRGTKLNLWQ